MTSAAEDGPLSLPAASVAASSRAGSPQPPSAGGVDRPVARVAVLTPLPHLDHPLDYAVPEALASQIQPGVRVRVRLAGRLVDGFVLDRVDRPESDRVLQPVRSVHGPPVLTRAIARLCREVADRYAGTFADVVRAAVPPRHARVEASLARRPDRGLGPPAPGAPTVVATDAAAEGRAAASDTSGRPRGWLDYRGGRALVEALGAGSNPRVSWASGPGEDVPALVAELVRCVVATGRGALVVAADDGEVGRLTGALGHAGVSSVALSARLGPQARYRAFLQVLSGTATVVVGTRGAVFAPVSDLGLLVVLDDADDSLAEPHAPGWHAREVAALRAATEAVALVLAGPAVSLEAQRMVAVGWLGTVELPRIALRARAPRVQAADDAAAGDPARAASRIPSVALEVLRAAEGPVLVQVPRAGYLPSLLCDTCRELAACPQCASPLRAEAADAGLVCPRDGRLPPWRCPHCGGSRVRATVIGVRRTAEEFGRALPGVPVVSSSSADGIARTLAHPRGVVVATPGAEPQPGPDGYAALILLDVAAAMSRPGLRVAEEVLRRWLIAASLVRPGSAGGRVLVVGDGRLREVQALVRWDPRGYAQRELDERLALALPPAVRTARLTGPALEVAEVVHTVRAELGPHVRRCSGPLPPDEPARADEDEGDRATWVLGVSPADGPRLTVLLQHLQAHRSVRRAAVVRVRMDPTTT